MARANARDAILDRAAQLASVRGLDGLTIGGLAAEIGMSKGGICAHFPSKAELQLATVERATERFRQAVMEPALAAEPGLVRLRALDEAWFTYGESFVFEGGCFFTKVMLELADIATVPARETVRARLHAFIHFVEECIREAVDRGQLKPDTDPQRFAIELQGLHAAALLRTAMGLGPEPYTLARDAAERLIQRHLP